MTVYGQDWSSYQSAMPDTSGISFAFTKVTEGLGYINPKWVSQRDHAKAGGLVWGGYHYPHMGNSVQAEADYFLAQVAWKPGDLVALDWEGYDAANQSVPHAQQLAYKEAWLRYVKKKLPNNRVGMYCSKDYWLNVDTTSYCGDFLWIATAGLPAGQPGIKDPWKFHQYSDNPVDKDVANFPSVADLKAWAGASTPAPKPSPAPTPTPATPQWQKLLDHVMSVPEGVYEHWTSAVGWDNVTAWGTEYGEQGVSWCVIWDWCMYNEVGLSSIVPKTDNVADFTNWAQQHGQWSLYPSVGAWCNFDNGGHTEIVIGFDDQRVYTKGGNSIQAGSQDSGQGNGVWSHEELRRATRVIGYFAPHFPDGHCPPTADPNDPRGGTAQTSYTPPEADMPLTDADVQKVVNGVLGYKNADALKKNPSMPDVYGYIAGTSGAVASLTAQVGALSGAITALTKAGGITAEQVQAAAAAGAKTALEELAQAIGKVGA